jgi:hypothetical protein
VHNLIEEVLKKHQVRLEENKTKILKDFEKDLPETIVPDEQLRFVLDSILQYVIASKPSNGSIEFLTKSPVLQKETGEDQTQFRKNGRYIEIMVAFTYYKDSREQPVPQKEVALDLMLRLVNNIVERNQGMIKFEFDETKGKRFLSLKFPFERRKLVRYE